MSTPLVDIGAVPTFIGSGILFLASGAMVVACANTMFEKQNGILVYQTRAARRLRGLLARFAEFLIIAYGLLFASFFVYQVIQRFEVIPYSPIAYLLNENNIYMMQILLFPCSVLFAASLVRMYIYIRSK
jgi:hypothetical protein